ncbi:MAG: VCBS repeat-containing protein [Thermoanaerobaculia bacterium]|nr:VCBS repeat-containing protein [Thermoanaerobaculia bacterium]
MNQRMCSGLVVGGLLLAAFPAASEPRARVEVSADGLETVELPAELPPATGQANSRGAAVFPLTPDWSNAFRIQVGGLAAADVNGDQLVDVVVGCYTSNSFPPYPVWRTYIYYNTGGQLEATPSWTSTDEVSTGDIDVGDVNRDGFPDVVAANGGFAMSKTVIYFGAAGGPSTSPGWFESTTTWTNDAILFDFDHDGDLDLATANQGNSSQDPYRPMQLFLNDAGTLSTSPAWTSAESSIQNFLSWGDLDGDGWEDLAVSKWANFETGVYKNVMGTLQTTPIWTTGDTDTDRGVGWADVDGDDDPDLALGHDPTLLYTNTGGTLASTWSANGTFFGQQDLRWFDVDRDGTPIWPRSTSPTGWSTFISTRAAPSTPPRRGASTRPRPAPRSPLATSTAIICPTSSPAFRATSRWWSFTTACLRRRSSPTASKRAIRAPGRQPCPKPHASPPTT